MARMCGKKFFAQHQIEQFRGGEHVKSHDLIDIMRDHGQKNSVNKQRVGGEWMDPEFQEGLVSVIIPTYNRADLIRDALDSVWEQTYRPIELIIVDDGSTDQTQEVVRKWALKTEEDPEFELRYLKQKNQGAPAARNRGLLESKGEFIQFLDSDDLYVPHKTEWGLQDLHQSSCSYVYFITQFVDSELRPKEGVTLGEARGKTSLDIFRLSWHSIACLYKRVVPLTVGPWREKLRWSQDVDYSRRVKLHEFKSMFDDRVAALYRQHADTRITDNQKGDVGLTRASNEELLCDSIRSCARRVEREEMLINIGIRYKYILAAISYREGNCREGVSRCLKKCMSVSGFTGPIWCFGAASQIFFDYGALVIFGVLNDIRRRINANLCQVLRKIL